MKSTTNIRTQLAFAVSIIVALAGCGETDEPTAITPAPDPEPVEEIVADHATVKISNAMGGWLTTGLEIEAGDSVVLSGTGTWSAEGMSLAPRHMLWYRIGEHGEAWNFSADQEIFRAETTGALFVTLRPLGVYWDDARGTYPPGFTDAPAVPVDIGIAILRFQAPLESGLAELAAAGDADATNALATLAARKSLPEGFFYLPYLGRANIWAAATVDGRPGIQAETSDDAGIVKRPLDIPLTEDTTFSFEWRYDSLPALGPETEAQFHDYLSIALEFDNGQDLTWMWSPQLDAGTHFGCPLPGWDDRETHYVLTSGRENLGSWESHTRQVLADYRESISVEEPTRIVGVWFIANSLFGRQPGAASFGNVSVTSGDTRSVVFGD